MSGCMFATGACICCNRIFVFNPLSVPSTRAINGQSEPICSTCIDLINRKRAENGLAAWPIAADAYSEAVLE